MTELGVIGELEIKSNHFLLNVSSTSPRLYQFNPIIRIGLKLSENRINFDGFHSKAASDSDLRNTMTDADKQLWKGLAYAWLCWLLNKAKTYIPSYTDNTPVYLIAHGHVDPEQKDLSALVLYYATMGFGISSVREVESDEGEDMDEEFSVPSELFDSVLKLRQSGKLTWKAFHDVNSSVPKYVYDTIEETLLDAAQESETHMESTLGKILGKCWQSKNNNEKRKIFCSSENKVPLIKLKTPEKTYTGNLIEVLPSSLRIFLEC